MKGFTLFLTLASFSILSAEEKPVETVAEVTPSKHISYVSMGTSFSTRDHENLNNHLVHFGVGSRRTGIHGLDVHSHFALNQTYVNAITHISYMYSPEIFFGAYVGLGVKFGLSVGKHTTLTFADPSYLTEGENIGLISSQYPGPYLKTAWSKNYIADLPLILGYRFEKEGKHHFVQAELDKDLKLSIVSGIGF